MFGKPTYWIIPIMALFIVSCENSLLEHDHEHTHEHSHEINNEIRNHWHSYKGIHFTRNNISNEEVKNQMIQIFDDIVENGKISKYLNKSLNFRGVVISNTLRDTNLLVLECLLRKEGFDGDYFIVHITSEVDQNWAIFTQGHWYTLTIIVTEISDHIRGNNPRIVRIFGHLR
jgi:hypothetical protein